MQLESEQNKYIDRESKRALAQWLNRLNDSKTEQFNQKPDQNNLSIKYRLQALIEKHQASLGIGFLGIIFLCLGIFFLLYLERSQNKIQIIPAEETQTAADILADIEGAVIHPGVYKLPFGSRVNDLLIAAGGLSLQADREWIEAFLNKAEKLDDGAKIYIPAKGEAEKTNTVIGSSLSANTAAKEEKININSASLAELDTLYGVGPATAQKIIDNRPYQSIEDLLTKKILNRRTYDRIKNQLTLF